MPEMRDMSRDELLAKLEEGAQEHSAAQQKLEKLRRKNHKICKMIAEIDDDMSGPFAQAALSLRKAMGHQKLAHAEDDWAACIALGWDIPVVASR